MIAQETVQPGANKLLSALPSRERTRLLRELEPVVFSSQESLYEPESVIRYVYFPMSGMISLLLVMNDASIAEVGRVGNEGMVGLPIFLGVRTSRTRALVQIPGRALRMKANLFLQEVRKGGTLSALLLRYTQALLHHSERLAACNNRHTIDQRLCRWLLVTHDRIQADLFEITQDFLAQMLGTHRQSITLAASGLQRAGLIRYSRGKLRILDRKGLETASCECYQAVKREFETLYA